MNINRIIRSAAKARSNSPEEFNELVSLFGETWAKCVAEHVHGPITTLVYARMEQDYVDYMRVKGRHPLGLTGVGDTHVDVTRLDVDAGEDDDGNESLTPHETTSYPADVTPEGFADPSVEIELDAARRFVATAPRSHRSYAARAAVYPGTTLPERATKATRDARRAWRTDAFAKGAGGRIQDWPAGVRAGPPVDVEKTSAPLSWRSYGGYSPAVNARCAGLPRILSPNTSRDLRTRPLDWINGNALEYGKPVSTAETPAEHASIVAYIKRQPEPYMAPQTDDDDTTVNRFGEDRSELPKLFDEVA